MARRKKKVGGRPPVGTAKTVRYPDPELERAWRLMMPGETEAAVMRRVFHAGLDVLEAQERRKR